MCVRVFRSLLPRIAPGQYTNGKRLIFYFVCVLLRKRVADGICKLLHGHMAAGVANVDNVWIVVLRPACQAVSNVPGFEHLAGAAVIADLAVSVGVVNSCAGDGAQVGHFDSVLIDFHFVYLLPVSPIAQRIVYLLFTSLL